jgi:hypothetical protein
LRQAAMKKLGQIIYLATGSDEKILVNDLYFDLMFRSNNPFT